MINVIGQSVEGGNETGARQLFDVLETLLILEVPILGQHIPQLAQFLLQCGANRNYDPDLRVLAIAAPPRSLVAEDGTGILETEREGLFLVLIEIEPANRGSKFRAQAMIPIVELKSVQVLPEFLAKTGKEEIAAFEDWHIDRGISCLRYS